MFKKIEEIFKRRVDRQTPICSLPMSFKNNKKYIMFPWLGLLHWIVLTLLFIFCINYNNNLGMAGVCFLASYYFVSIFRNYFSFKSLKLIAIKQNAHDEEREGVITFVFTYPDKFKKSYPLLWLTIHDQNIPIEFKDGVGVVSWNYGKIPAGVFTLPTFSISSYWPVSITKTWCYIKTDTLLSIAPVNNKDIDDTTKEKKEKNEGQSIHSNQGDIEGIREVLPDERINKISWKHSIKQEKLMTYTWEENKKNSILIEWPNTNDSDLEKAKVVRSQIDSAVLLNLSFKIHHPKFQSSYGRGEDFGIQTLCKIMQKTIPSNNLEEVLNSREEENNKNKYNFFK